MRGAAVTNFAQQGIQGLTKGPSALDGKSEMRHAYISGSPNYHVTESLGSLFSHRAPALPSFSISFATPRKGTQESDLEKHPGDSDVWQVWMPRRKGTSYNMQGPFQC